MANHAIIGIESTVEIQAADADKPKGPRSLCRANLPYRNVSSSDGSFSRGWCCVVTINAS